MSKQISSRCKLRIVTQLPPSLEYVLRRGETPAKKTGTSPDGYLAHTCHILPPSEIDLGLRLAVFAGSGRKYLFHKIG